jgi:hypothetical protein
MATPRAASTDRRNRLRIAAHFAAPRPCAPRDAVSHDWVDRKPASSLPSRENFDASSEESDRHLNDHNYLL